MSANDRFRRPDPTRTAPVRTWSALVRPGGAPESPNDHSENGRGATDASPGGAGASEAATPNGEIADAVATAYRVVDRHLSAGRAAARSLGRGSAEADRATEDGADRADYGSFAALGAGLEEMIGEAARAFAGMMPAFSAILEVLGRPPYTGLAAANGRDGSSAPRGNPDAAPEPNFAIEVTSVRPARVALDLAPGADPATLAIAGLHSIEAGRPPLAEVAFIPGGKGERPVLSIRVPATAAPGIYAGAIVDRRNGEPRGTISVKVGE